MTQPNSHTTNDENLHAAHERLLASVDRPAAIKRARTLIYVIAALLVIGSAHSVIKHINQNKQLEADMAVQQTVYVHVMSPQEAKQGEPLRLPATIRGDEESPIYPRASGYVLHRFADIGSTVKRGELLAEIDTPDVDQQLAQAVATRNQVAASAALAKSSFTRWQALRQKDAVSQQELDERQSAFNQSQADLAAADANVKRLEELESFKRVVAPFDGIVTLRNADVGALVNSGTGSVNQPMFMLAKIDTVRAYINVPQAYSQQIKPGDKIKLTQAELPDEVFQGTVSKTAHAIDSVTRTMQIEVTLPNRDHKLMPGAYAEVALAAKTSEKALIVPANVLLFRAEGTQVAVVGDDGLLHIKPVTVGRDMGKSVEIVSGVTAQDRVIINPLDSATDKQPVKIVPNTEHPA
ncbi:MAG: efflux RND transporter periplasmic adaptor subunit [Burkholderiales bacterium]|nr:efflux RND transporter periplasmic adaptor subunit [Burkholderiales bacterium]